MLFLRLLAIACIGSSTIARADSLPVPTLDWLEAHAPKGSADAQNAVSFHDQVVRMIEANTLKSGNDFFRASCLASFGFDEPHKQQERYELLLAAIARDEITAEKYLGSVWDWFLWTRGRPMRFDVDHIAAQHPDDFDSDPAPKVIQSVWLEPAKAQELAREAKNNPEIARIVEADQAARRQDWSKLSSGQLKVIDRADAERNARIRAIVAAGDLRTSEDFASASLVMQHSAKFSGYQLAHELAVCSLLLGDRQGGRWLVAATYDRMMESIGLRQRFGTQYLGEILARVDTEGICDEERRALGCPTLDARHGDDAVHRAEQLYEQKRFAEAEAAAREGVAIRARNYESTDWHPFSAKRVLGAALLAQRKYEEAETVLLDAYRGLSAPKSGLPDNYRDRITETASYLAKLYDEQHQVEKAQFWRQRAADKAP